MANEFRLSFTAEEIDEKLRKVDNINDAVKFTSQTLTEEQKVIVRENIGAASKSFESYITPDMFGVVADGVTDNHDGLQAMFDYAIQTNKNVYIPTGIYAFSGQILFPLNQQGMIITGEGKWKTIFKALSDDAQFYFSDFLRYEISQMQFIGTGTETVPLFVVASTAHLSSIHDCVFFSNKCMHLDMTAYLELRSLSFAKINGHVCNYLLKVNSGEYLYLTNCYFEGRNETLDDCGIIIEGLHDSYFTKCDICNFRGGTGIMLRSDGEDGGVYNVALNNTTFIRNKLSLKILHDYGMDSIGISECHCYLEGDEDYIIHSSRNDGAWGVLSNLYGDVYIRGTIKEGATLFYGTVFRSNNYLKVYNQTSHIYNYSDVFPLIPIADMYTNHTVHSTNSNVVDVLILENSPYKDWNLPTLKWGVTNGARPLKAEIINTFQGNMYVRFTYDESTTKPFTSVICRFIV